MSRDPYTVLGVTKSATDSEIKSAYRRLAKRYHPDTNTQDPNAQERFAEVNSAYEIVGDKEKRKQFDRGEIDADGNQRFQGGFGSGPGAQAGDPFGGFSGFGADGGPGGAGREQSRTWRFTSTEGPGGVDEILREFMSGRASGGRQAGFGSAQPEKGQDLEVLVTVTLEDLARDEKLRVTLPTGKTVDVKIPPGAEPDQQIRLRRLGHDSPTGGQPGDALLTLRIASHSVFQRDGANIRLNLPVTLYDAVLGAKVRAQTLTGSVNVTIPKASSSGKTLRLRGLGLPAKSGGRGDLLVTLMIDLPAEMPDDFVSMMERWREDAPYLPRAPGAGA